MKRQIVLISSLVAGLVAALLTRVFISAKEAEVKELKESLLGRYGTVSVVVLTRDLPSGATIEQGDLGSMNVPALGMRGQAVPEDEWRVVVGRRLIAGHKRRDVLFWSDVEGGDPSLTGLSADVKRQMRAMSITCSGAASVSGMVRPNDHVDVIGTFDLTEPGASSQAKSLLTCTLLQNVLVLATGSQTSKTKARDLGLGSGGYSTVTLEVSPREAEVLAFSEQIKGRLVLTLRNRNDASFEKELPKVDFERIRGEIEGMNLKRQQEKFANH